MADVRHTCYLHFWLWFGQEWDGTYSTHGKSVVFLEALWVIGYCRLAFSRLDDFSGRTNSWRFKVPSLFLFVVVSAPSVSANFKNVIAKQEKPELGVAQCVYWAYPPPRSKLLPFLACPSVSILTTGLSSLFTSMFFIGSLRTDAS